MTIEQDALQVAEFLRSLRKQIVEHPEFGRLYGEAGRLDEQVDELATALTVNYDRLLKARRKMALYPGRRQYQDEVDTYLEGLAGTTLQIDSLWHQFRTATLAKTESLIIRVEEEVSKQMEQGNTDDSEEDTSEEAEQNTPKHSWFKNALAGLNQFKNFLTAATDIKIAAAAWSPVLADTFRSALNHLGQLGNFIGQSGFHL